MLEHEEHLAMDLREIGWRVWIGFIWLRIVTSDRLLGTQ
jgi:hypothetical protein